MTSPATNAAARQCLTMIASLSNRWTFGSGLNRPDDFRDAAITGGGVAEPAAVGEDPRESNMSLPCAAERIVRARLWDDSWRCPGDVAGVSYLRCMQQRAVQRSVEYRQHSSSGDRQ